MLIAPSVSSNVDYIRENRRGNQHQSKQKGQSTLEQTEGAINIRANRRGNQH
jgi:hypothetical protein